MARPAARIALFLCALGLIPSAMGQGPAPVRGALAAPGRVTPDWLRGWKAKGANCVVVPLNEETRAAWGTLAARVAAENLALYAWVEVGRNPALADAHPEWMASPGGHHADWRRRFPDAPEVKAGEALKVWPWVPVGYAPAFEAHRERLRGLLEGLPGPWAGAFLNDLQGGPSSCGCGNDRCRWALDYGSKPTAPRVPGEHAAARLVTEVRERHPGKEVIPVWVTECEPADLPRDEGGSGLCGVVACARTSCWPNYAKTWGPVVGASRGSLAVALWSEAFGLGDDWPVAALALFRKPLGGATPVPPGRAVGVYQGWGKGEEALAGLLKTARESGAGWVIAVDAVDQSWAPRVIRVAD